MPAEKPGAPSNTKLAAEKQLTDAEPQLPAATDTMGMEDEPMCEEPPIFATKVIHCGWLDNTLPPPRGPSSLQESSFLRYRKLQLTFKLFVPEPNL